MTRSCSSLFVACFSLGMVWQVIEAPVSTARKILSSEDVEQNPYLSRQGTAGLLLLQGQVFWYDNNSRMHYFLNKSSLSTVLPDEGLAKMHLKNKHHLQVNRIRVLTSPLNSTSSENQKRPGPQTLLTRSGRTINRNKRQIQGENNPFPKEETHEVFLSHEEDKEQSLDNDKEEELNNEEFGIDATTMTDEDEVQENRTTLQMCRSWQTMLPRELFLLDASAHCFGIITRNSRNWTMTRVPVTLGDNTYSVTALVLMRGSPSSNNSGPVFANVSSPELRQSFSTDRDLDRWQACAAAAARCCSLMLSTPPAPENAGALCPKTWDRLQCWQDTPASTTALNDCPRYFDAEVPCGESTARAQKRCLEDGHWFRHHSNKEWTNYTECSLQQMVAEHIKLRMRWHIAVCSLSVAALLPALVIFFSYRQLQVRRITLHKHLFMSLILEAIFNICLRSLQISSPNVIQLSPWWCVLLNVCLKYLRQSNYMWFFNEGFYLHRLLASAFAEQRNFLLFYCLGWAVPVVPVMAYVLARALYFSSLSGCMILPQEGIEWLLMILPFTAIITNVVFFINIIRILLIKLKATSEARNDIRQYKAMARATLMVVPLFGLQFLLTIYRPGSSACRWITYYNILNHVIEGSTGMLVAVIFCYMNSEVRALLKRSCRCLTEELEHRGFPRMHESIQMRSRYSMSTVHTLLPDTHASTNVAANSVLSPPALFTPSQVTIEEVNSDGHQSSRDSTPKVIMSPAKNKIAENVNGGVPEHKTRPAEDLEEKKVPVETKFDSPLYISEIQHVR